MNIFKKIYCRVFQTGLKLSLPFLPYRTPTILNSTRAVADILRERAIDSVLLVTDKGIRNLGLLDEMLANLDAQKIAYTIYDETVANPTTENVEAARERYLQNYCRAIVGFGGGSSIDCAKAVGVRIARPKKTLAQMKGILKVFKRLPLLIAVPTTAGTGSETTLAAVITDAKTRHKYAINDFPLIPKYAVLDPKITLGLPPMISATTGMDALTHAVEAFIGNSTMAGTRRDALRATKLIFENIFEVCKNGGNIAARKNMLEASFYAGCAFTKSYVGYVHAVAHSLGGKYNIPHGLANAVLLPIVLKAYGNAIHKKLKTLAIAAGVADEEDVPANAAQKFIVAIEKMQRALGVPAKLAGIVPADIPALAKIAEREANPLYPVPVLMTARELEQFYRAVMEN